MSSPQCLKDLLIQDEGLKLKPYTDTVGKITLGVGRNLSDVGISFDEAMMLLRNDIAKARSAAQTFSWFNNLNPVRQDVIISLIFNMGLGGFSEFKNVIAALYDGKNATASEAMLDSKWAKQVGDRAVRLSHMMMLGMYPP